MDLHVCVTRRHGDIEERIEIGKPPTPMLAIATGLGVTFGRVVPAPGADQASDDEGLVAGDQEDMADALKAISQELGCQNTEDDILHAIDALRLQASSQLEWSGTLCDGERVNYAAAEKACAALGEGWRLPTRPELESILDLGRHDPAIDKDRFPNTVSGYYWTSTPCAWSSVFAWIVHFNDGDVGLYRRDGVSAFVRAVRSVPAGQ